MLSNSCDERSGAISSPKSAWRGVRSSGCAARHCGRRRLPEPPARFLLSGLSRGSVLRSFSLNRWSWRNYLLNRLTRLYVVLIPALLFGGLLDVAGIHPFGPGGIYSGQTGTHELTFAVLNRLSVPILVGNYAFLQGIYVPTFGSNGPQWSLANEFWYYRVFPLLACALWPRLPVARRRLSVLLWVAQSSSR